MEQYFVYILFSGMLNRYYVGSTSNVPHRIAQHNSRHRGFTSAANDWVLKHSESFLSRQDAEFREKQIKKWKSGLVIEKFMAKVG